MNDKYRKEWLSEEGYCNCLLVAMSRTQTSTVDIFLNRELPNLETIAKGKPETVSWIETQKLDYTLLNPARVIEILSRSADISLFPLGAKAGFINVHDVVGDNGPIVQHVFNLKLTGFFSKHLRIELKDAQQSSAGDVATRAAPEK